MTLALILIGIGGAALAWLSGYAFGARDEARWWYDRFEEDEAIR